MEQTKRLYRSRSNRVLGGVAGGLGDYFGIDPVIVRVLFVLISLGHGFGVLLYLVLWVIIPEEPLTHGDEGAGKADSAAETTAKKGKKDEEDFEERVEKVAHEVREKFRDFDDDQRRQGRSTGGVILVLVGLFLLLGNLFSYDFIGRFWPLILIVIGLIIMTRQSTKKDKE